METRSLERHGTSRTGRPTRRSARSLFVVALLALGIGLSTALFSVLDGVAVRGLPYPDGDRIVLLSTSRGADVPTPAADVRELGRRLTAGGPGGTAAPFAELAAFRTFNTVITRPGVGSRGLTATYVTWNLFRMLGAEPVLGRGFMPEDEEPSRTSVALISHGVWQTQFGGRADALGETVVVNREPMTVVGVMPEGFGFPLRQEAWAVLRWEGRPWSREPAFVVAKLRPGWSAEAAEAGLASVAAALDREHPLPETREAHVQPYVETLLPPAVDRSLRLMVWGALGLLVVASANAASLRLSDALARRHEIAIRRSLGAGTGALLRLLLAETAYLAGAAMAAGLSLAWLLVAVASAVLLRGSPLVRYFWVDVTLDPRSCLFAAGTATVALLVGGLPPALVTLRQRDLVGAGRRASRGSGVGRGARRLAGILVSVQVALAFALVSGSAVLTRSALGLLAREPGFDESRLVSARVTGYQADLATPEERRAFWEGLFGRLEADPAIAGATLASATPWRGGVPAGLRLAAADPADVESLPHAELVRVRPGFFETLRLPILAGRSFGPSDAPPSAAARDGGPERELPAVVSAGLARRHLGRSPNGSVFEVVPTWSRQPVRVRVVGVVADLGLGRGDRPGEDATVYVPVPAGEGIGGVLLVRGRTGTAGLVRTIEEAVAAVNPLVATLDAETFEEGYAEESWVERRLAQVASLFAVSCLLLSALGLFAAVELDLLERTRELAVRSALGALPRQLGSLLFRTGAVRAAAGLALGAALLWPVGRLLRPFLHGVEPLAPGLTAGAAALVAVVLGAAILGPLRRAAGTDPARALASE